MVKVALDAMGGDNAPVAIVQGAIDAIKTSGDIKVYLVGKEALVREELAKYNYNAEQVEVVDATEVIEMAEPPVMAIRKKKDSSIVKALHLVKDGTCDAFVSAGSSGAVLVGGQLIVGRIKGVERPPMAPLIPTETGASLLIDCGANVDARPSHLVQFAKMGSVYMENVMGIKNPRVALLNIGAEEEKGTELIKESYQLLKQDKNINFVGNVEGRYIFDGNVDVIVSDGFSGNIALKTAEGLGAVVTKILKEELTKTLWSKICAMMLGKSLKKFKKRLDYTEYGGGILLGIDKPLVKCHGGAKEKLFKTTIIQAEKYAKSHAIDIIKEELEKEDLKK